MPRLRRLIAFVLLALWLPATLHCSLEAAGLDELFRCEVDHHSDSAESAARDACDILENGWIKRTSSSLSLPTPFFCVCLLCLAAPPLDAPPAPSSSVLAKAEAAPPELSRTWQFLSRAAPPSRAPSLAS